MPAPRLPQPAANLLVQRGDARPSVNHEQRHIGASNAHLGLRAHAAGQAGGIGILPAGGIDDGEIEADEMGLAHAPVSRDAGLIVDQRQFLADESVEQGRLADVGAADNDYLGKICVGHVTPQLAHNPPNSKQNGG